MPAPRKPQVDLPYSTLRLRDQLLSSDEGVSKPSLRAPSEKLHEVAEFMEGNIVRPEVGLIAIRTPDDVAASRFKLTISFPVENQREETSTKR